MDATSCAIKSLFSPSTTRGAELYYYYRFSQNRCLYEYCLPLYFGEILSPKDAAVILGL